MDESLEIVEEGLVIEVTKGGFNSGPDNLITSTLSFVHIGG